MSVDAWGRLFLNIDILRVFHPVLTAIPDRPNMSILLFLKPYRITNTKNIFCVRVLENLINFNYI